MKNTKTFRNAGILFSSGILAAAMMVAQPSTSTAHDGEDGHSHAESKPAVTTYAVDGGHSNVSFSITHSGVSKVHGIFHDVEGTIEFDPAHPEASSIDIVVKPGSVGTNSEGRDDHLRQSDYFNVAEFATATFKSESIKKAEGDNKFTVSGDLTIMGKTKPVTFTFNYNGEVEDKWGNTRTGGDAELMLDRTDWGVGSPGGTLSNDVKLMISLAAIKAS